MEKVLFLNHSVNLAILGANDGSQKATVYPAIEGLRAKKAYSVYRFLGRFSFFAGSSYFLELVTGQSYGLTETSRV